MPDEGFRLPDSSYELLSRIIMSYGSFKEPVSLSTVEKASAIHRTTISRNSGFLVEIQVLEGGNKKALTPAGRALAQALHHEIPEEIQAKWLDIVSGNDFVRQILSAVRIRKGMERSALQAHISYSAGQAKSDTVKAGANCLVEILLTAALLREEHGKLVAVPESSIASSEVDELIPSLNQDPANSGAMRRSENRSNAVDPHTSVITPIPGIGINIQIQIQCDVAELDELGSRLRSLMVELSKAARDIDLHKEDGLEDAGQSSE